MPTIRPKFGALVTAIRMAHGRDGKPASLRQGEIRTGLPHSTIHNMSDGIVPTDPDKVRQFADGYKKARVPMLVEAGFQPTDEDRAWDAAHYGHKEPVNEHMFAQEERAKHGITERESDLAKALRSFGGFFNFMDATPLDPAGGRLAYMRYVVRADEMPGYRPGTILYFDEAYDAEPGDYVILREGDSFVPRELGPEETAEHVVGVLREVSHPRKVYDAMHGGGRYEG